MSKKYELQHNIVEVAPLVKLHMGYLNAALSKKAEILRDNPKTMEKYEQIQIRNDVEEIDRIVDEYLVNMNQSHHHDFELKIQFNLKTESKAEIMEDYDEFSNYGFKVRHIDNCLKCYYCGCFMGNDYEKLAFSISVFTMVTKKHISNFLAWSALARMLLQNHKVKHIEITLPERY
jgi:hypothetical protein